jgi:hypothetical protein
MILTWEGDRALADVEMLARLYEVSERTVRRRCRPVRHEPRTGRPRGAGGRALYDALAAGEQLADVAPRPERTMAALRYRANVERGRGGP